MSENEILKEIKKLGYKYLLEHDSISEDLAYIEIIPKKMIDGSLRVTTDIIDLLKDYGFEFDGLVINSKMVKEFGNEDILVIFKNIGADEK